VKVGVQPGSWSHLNEWFGPVLGVMVAKDLDEATSWQNQVPYGLTGGLHSLNQAECEQWIDRVEVGNLYLNRGVTGAIVRRQPFGGWKRSSVGATAKAGGANYVNCLRHWPRVADVEAALAGATMWWQEFGSQARDDAGLSAERNVVRYCRPRKSIAIRIDDASSEQLWYLRGLIELAGLDVEFSAESLVRGLLDVTLESVQELVNRSASFSKVRWLSGEVAPTLALLESGVSVDTRALAQSGSVELPRWLLEQSVAITNHRYGNVHAGPKPLCRGLGERETR
jgi:RHH-type proline utilization regulon transcriptional repressor/proline dehydrogenase/delta 1-pyrroline-5-carboxylate dehydrogenase